MKAIVSLAFVGILATAYLVNAQVESTPPAGHAEHQPGAAEETEPLDMNERMQLMNESMVQHLGESDEQYDARFIDMMIPHHEGAVMMARHALEHSQRPELRAMAKKVIKDQKKEIEQMKQWRKAWYGESALESTAPETTR